MRINNNISAMNAHRILNVNNTTAAKSLEKLSSGKRINKAADDAAGMAISEKMRAQINGLKIASRNTLDGVSMVQTAEGAMAEVTAMLQRMRELAVQAANGTMTESDRSAVQDEINQLTSEINRIGNGTEYNTRKILRGNEGPNSNTTVHRMSTGEPAAYVSKIAFANDSDVKNLGNLASKNLSIWIDGEEKVVNLNRLNGSDAATKDVLLESINNALGESAKAIYTKDNTIEIRTTSIGGSSQIEITGSAANIIFDNTAGANYTATGKAENANNKSKGSFYFEALPQVKSTLTIGSEKIEFYDSSKEPYIGSNRGIDIYDSENSQYKSISDIVKEIEENIQIDGIKLLQDTDVPSRLKIEAEEVGFKGNLIYLEGTPKEFLTNLQIGSNSGQGFRLEIGDIRSLNLRISSDNPDGNPGVKGASYVAIANVTDGISANRIEYALDISSEEKASAAITVIDNAILKVTAERSKLGATQNRLEHTIQNLDNTAENLTASLSRIEDVDMALEMANFTKFNVLQQAGVSMLAQANQQPQAILKLLG
ncbi:flagellin N-terminal helical domain-containing protein [Alkalithermobacter paradoxus]|uniref:Flagellin n=1 Tax=Alkalithermobacter paradoxus TaxID=29349 RepID=A0A1V4I813_9FIRM|nr:flagellin [[Clostridium] thermoalcaliphilum]